MKRLYTLLATLSIACLSLSAHFASASTTSSVLLPKSDGNYLQFQPKTNGAAHYTMVNESLCNGTTNYNTATTVGLRDSYGISVTSIGDGALISQVGVVPCASLNTSGGTATTSVFYRWNGVDSADKGTYKLTGTTPVQLTPTSTYPGLSLFKTSTSILEIGAVLIAQTSTSGMRLSRIATVLTYTLTTPTSASSLVATDASASQINLAWNDNSNNELGFKIYRKLNNGSFAQVATTVSWNATSYNDTGLTADQTYSYKVIAYNSMGTSTSNISTAITYSSIPTTPSNLSAVTSSNNIVLTWSDNSTNEDGFKIERSTDNITYTQIATTTQNIGTSTTSYTDVAAGGTARYYRVKAYNTIGSSAYVGAVEGIYTVIVSGIYSDTTWTPGNIYRLDSTLSVTTAKLTIQAGTIVKLGASVGLSVSSAGVLSVQGISNGNVYFTSLKDDSLGGDTNGDTTSTVPAPNDWDSIQLYYGASSTVSYATVTYGGSNGNNASLYNNGGILTISHAIVFHSSNVCVYTLSGTTAVSNSDLATYQSSGGYGVYVAGGTVTVSSNTIHDNDFGIYASGSASLSFINNTLISNNTAAAYLVLSSGLSFTNSGNTVSGAGKHRIALSSSPTVNQTWNADSVAYTISSLGLTVPSGQTLTIGPGAVVKFDHDTVFPYNYGGLEIAGTLVAEGTADRRIYFTSLRDDSTEALGDSNNDSSTPSAPDWDAVKLDSGASSTISNAVVRYGGYGSSGYEGELQNNGGTFTLDTVETATSGQYGINQASGTSTIISSNIHANSYGFYSGGGYTSISLSQVHDNSTNGIRAEGGTVTTTASDIYSNNYGIYAVLGTVGVSKSAIHGNTVYGIDNVSGPSVDAYNNFWGCDAGPNSTGATTPPCNNGRHGDLTSAGVVADPWIHDQAYWAARSFALTWRNINSIYTDELSAATFNWNSTTAGMGIIPVASTTNASLENLTISDYSDSSDSTSTGKDVCGITTAHTIAESTTDTIQFNEYCMDTRIGQVVPDEVSAIKHAVVVHELGHALGLGHSDPIAADVMYAYWNLAKTDGFGIEDQRDYNFLWNTMRWATSSWWPK